LIKLLDNVSVLKISTEFMAPFINYLIQKRIDSDITIEFSKRLDMYVGTKNNKKINYKDMVNLVNQINSQFNYDMPEGAVDTSISRGSIFFDNLYEFYEYMLVYFFKGNVVSCDYVSNELNSSTSVFLEYHLLIFKGELPEELLSVLSIEQLSKH
jgi:hypothetical protein